MTSQRDEITPRPAGEGVADDSIIIERHDEILTGDEPAWRPTARVLALTAGESLAGTPRRRIPRGQHLDRLVVPAEPAAGQYPRGRRPGSSPRRDGCAARWRRGCGPTTPRPGRATGWRRPSCGTGARRAGVR